MLKLAVGSLVIVAAVGIGSTTGRAAEAAPVSEFSMTQLVRDEHDLVTNMVRQAARRRAWSLQRAKDGNQYVIRGFPEGSALPTPLLVSRHDS